MNNNFCRIVLVVVSLLVGALALMGMGGKPSGVDAVATVSRVSISDRQVLTRNVPVVVTFSSAMVNADALDKAVEPKDMPFSVEPAVEGDGRWLTENSFAFAATNGFPRGKEYFLLFKDNLRALDGKPVRYLFSFKTESTKVTQVSPGEYDVAKQQFSLGLNFNLPVSTDALRDHLVITDEKSGAALTFSIKDRTGESTSQNVRIQLGEYRPKISIVARVDSPSDTNLLGLASEYRTAISLPAPNAENAGGETVARVEGNKKAPSPQRISDPYSGEDDGVMYARFPLREALAAQSQKDFISVSPDLRYTMNDYNDSLRFDEGLEPGMSITVTLKPGLVDSSGRVLQEELSRTMVVGDREPSVRFAERGSFLTPEYGTRVGLSMVNVDKVTVTLRRQYDNNMPFMTVTPEYQAREMMRNIGFKEFTVSGKKNEVLRRAVDIEELAKGKHGVFFLTVRGYKAEKDSRGNTDYSSTSTSERLVVLSDIGVTARQFPSGITVFAAGISSAKPLPGAQVKVYSASNQLIAQGETAADGIFKVSRAEPWDPQLRPNVVTVSTGTGDNSDLTFLPLDYSTTIEQTDSASRSYLDKGYEAFLYTPRGVFRPGETVDVKAFVRDADHMPPAPFPVLFRIVSSRGLEMARGSATLSGEGGADFSFALPKSAPTGTYYAHLEIPGQKGTEIGQVEFSVEDFVPPRLEVQVTPKAESLLAGSTLPVNLSGQYLFGAPGSDLKFELGYKATPKAFTPTGWDGYVFGDMEREFTSQLNLKYITGELKADGTIDVDFKAPSDWQPPSLLQVLLVGGVQEDGGRWVAQTNTFTYFPTPYLLGLKAQDEALAPGKAGIIKVAAVDPAGKAVESGTLSAEVFLVQGNWHTVYRNGRYVYTWDERLIPQVKRTVTTKDGQGELSFTPAQYGRYLVRMATQDGKIVGSRRISAWGSGGTAADDGTGRMDTVELSFDKSEYRTGEVAKLSVKAPYAGTLLLGVERGAQLSTRVIPMDKPATVVEIPVTQGMDPNVTVSAWVFRPVKAENKEWYAHRAHGIIPLVLAKAPHILKVEAQTPERAAPSKPLSIPFVVKDEKGNPVEGEFSVALIDEGILSLTTFKTPDPVEYFMARRRFVGETYDAYDALLRPEAKATALLKAGGDGSADYQGSLSTQQIFLTAYLPTVRTDASGQAVANFDIPEYSGKGRLMIVGSSKNLFASAASPVRFARDVVVEASAPRAVAPGDSFEVSLKAFVLPGSGKQVDGTANIKVTATGPLTLSGNVKAAIPLASGAGAKAPASHSISVRAEAQNESGVATITIAVDVPGRADLAFTKTVEVVVRPPYPRTSVVKTALIESGSENLYVPGKWLKGSVKTSFSIDKSPVLAVLPALDYLREYPYGCLEQTTSRAWPYLTLASVQKALHPEVDETANTKGVLSDAVGRITSMQTSDGGFAMWPGYSNADPWKSVNATFFLLEAKAQVPVSKSTLDRSLAYMRFLLAAPEEHIGNTAYAYSTKAYAAFVLTRAGEAPLGWMQNLTEHEDKMWPSGRIFLAAAKALKAGNPKALQALDEKRMALKTSALKYNESMESTLRNQSLRLYAWSLVAPDDKETLRLCVDVAERIAKSRWFTTQDAGMAALALGTFLEKTGGTGSGYTAEIKVAGKTLANLEKGERLVLSGNKLPLGADGSPADVQVTVGGEGHAYCVYSVRGVPYEAPAAASSNLVIYRVWKDANGKVIDLGKGATSIKKGDRITVELTLKPKFGVANVVLSDLLPGGMEVENPRLKSAANAAQSDSASSNSNGRSNEENDGEGDSDGESAEESSGNGMYLDLREDRLLVFFDRLDEETTYSYTMRAVTKGTFTLPPLAAEGMYAPDVNAITSSALLLIE